MDNSRQNPQGSPNHSPNSRSLNAPGHVVPTNASHAAQSLVPGAPRSAAQEGLPQHHVMQQTQQMNSSQGHYGQQRGMAIGVGGIQHGLPGIQQHLQQQGVQGRTTHVNYAQSTHAQQLQQFANAQRQQQQQQQQQQHSSPQQVQGWSVPNPLGTGQSIHFGGNRTSAVPQQQARPSTMQKQPQQAQMQQASAAQGASKPKPKVVLSTEAKQALAKAIWSAIRSPTGTIAPDLMNTALKTGLPRHAIENAARVAREREAAKRKGMQTGAGAAMKPAPQMQQQPAMAPSAPRAPPQQQQQQPQPRIQPIQPTLQASRPIQQSQQTPPVQQPVQQAKEMQAKMKERAEWKRVQNGIFMVQKDRFLAVPFSVGAMVHSTDVAPTIPPSRKRPRSVFLDEALKLQQQLQGRKAAGLSTSVSVTTEPLLDPERYKRIKIEPKKFAKGLDRVARKARQSVADTLVKQHKELAKAIASHQQDFFKFHRQRKAESVKLSKAIRDSFDKEAKKLEKDAIQAEKARLAALKANDMTAYSKLLEETKNDRLKFLLDKTEKHFTQISSLLQERSSDFGSAATAGNTSYYASAHMKTEEVRQPTILVGGDLKEYQMAGLQWLVSLYNNNLNGILADEMGLGKTIQAISLIAYLMEVKHNLGPYLVIVPLSTLSNWQNEFVKWCPAARTICYKGTPSQRKEIYRDQVRTGHFNVLLTTYEYIIKDKKFLRKIDWQYAIVDEGHRMKNAQSKFAVTLGTQYTTKYRILLTGTPLMNDLSELWSLLNFLLPTIFNSVETFDQWFSAPFSQFGGSGAAEDEGDQLLTNEERILVIHRLHELLRPFMLRRVKSQVLDQLPEKVEKVLRCELSSWQKELYKQISAKAVADTSIMGTEQQTPTRGLNNVVMQLRKVCNHPYLFSPEGYHISDKMIRSSGKFVLLDQMLPKLKAAGHRVLMFTQMTQVMTILEDYFAYRGYLSLRLDGSTPAEEREKRMYKFNAPDSPYFIFLLSTRAGGIGVNLSSASTVVIFDSDWNPMMDLQAQDRAHRIGQRSDVSVFRLVTFSPIEEKILSRASEKLNVSELVVESGQFNKQSVESDNSMERKKMMEVLLTDFDASSKPKAISEKSGSDEGDDDDDGGSEKSEEEDLNEMLSNNEGDYQLYAEFDERRGHVIDAPLFTAQEDVPDWIRYPQRTQAGAAFADPGDGSRKRKAVMYDDGLTEKQFLRMMEKQAIEEEQQQVRKRQKIQKIENEAPPAAAASASSEPVPASIGTTLTDWTFRKLISCSKSVVALKDPNTKRRLSELFLEKPDPATFPDYYEIVEKPMAINDILRKCRAKLYANLHEFKEDWKLMFANARKFNGEDSWVVEDAQALEKELERVLKKNGFSDDMVPTSKKKKLRIKLSLKNVKGKPTTNGQGTG